jgi:hypothetical protein
VASAEEGQGLSPRGTYWIGRSLPAEEDGGGGAGRVSELSRQTEGIRCTKCKKSIQVHISYPKPRCVLEYGVLGILIR